MSSWPVRFGGPVLLFAAITSVEPAAAAKPTQPPASDPTVTAVGELMLGISRTRLENGLRVVMNTTPESATVAVCVTYNVGSRHERPEQSGFAHLFEHMMFQGSRNVEKGDHFQLITSRGGRVNGTTSQDRTNYFQTLPANELPLALWLEADRMRWLQVDKTNFENQRSVVKEEYRMRVDNAPYRPALIELGAQLYEGYFPYAHPTIGSMQALDGAKLEWVREFFQRHYAPNNAVLSLVGGFDTDLAMAKVREYFSAIPAGNLEPFVEPPLPAAPTAERRLVRSDPNAKTSALLLGWRIPASRTRAHYALELLALILSDGDSSVLNQLLVRDRALAREVSTYTHDTVGPDTFRLTVELTQNAQPDKVLEQVDGVLLRLAKQGPSPAELSRAKQRLKSRLIFGLQSNQTQAILLGEYETLYGDARLLARDLEALLALGADEIRDAAAQYLTRPLRTVMIVNPEPTTTPVKEHH